jgi:lipid II:glycine glycyltransferase (peptidoglycan interpeptide bridge formation enzyme)
MEFEIKEIENKEVWENFLSECREKTFLQSWNWGEFQKMMGNKIWRFGIFENDNLISVAFFYKIQAKRGTFLFIPHGPTVIRAIRGRASVNISEDGPLSILLEKLKEIAKEEKCDFIRIAPILERNDENIKIFKNLGFREAPIHIHPELTWELDITSLEEELLMKMRKTTRYLIKQAQKNKDIEIIKSENLKELEEFNKLYQETVDRHHFVPFSFDYLKNEFLAFKNDRQILLFLGEYKGEVVSSGIFIFWQGIGFYHHGASSLKYPKIPVSYSLLWEAIREAKNRGCKKFNFWGIAPTISNFKFQISNLKHPWAGLTLFKTGFGGYKKEYLKTQDLVLSKKYWLNYLIEKFRKKKRGL